MHLAELFGIAYVDGQLLDLCLGELGDIDSEIVWLLGETRRCRRGNHRWLANKVILGGSR